NATTSACGPPTGAVRPSPTVAPDGSRMTAPTLGLGLVSPSPRAARSRARRIAACSAGLVTRAPSRRAVRADGDAGTGPATNGRPHGIDNDAARALPPIRTVTVGPGFSPGPPSGTRPSGSRAYQACAWITAGSEFHRVPPAR